MTPDPTDARRRLEADLRRVAAAQGRALDSHPTPDELVDYHIGASPVEAAELVQEHLSLCPECAQLVLDLAAFTSARTGESTLLSATDLNLDWEAVQRRLGGEADRSIANQASSRHLVLALAASLLLSVGLFIWALVLRDYLTEETRRPKVDIARLDLAPETTLQKLRDVEATTRAHLHPDQSQLLLLLNLGDLRIFPGYRLELLDQRRGLLWTDSGVQRHDDGTFLLEIPARMLDNKVYQVRLYGQQDRTNIPLATYSFEIVRSDRSSRDK